MDVSSYWFNRLSITHRHYAPGSVKKLGPWFAKLSGVNRGLKAHLALAPGNGGGTLPVPGMSLAASCSHLRSQCPPAASPPLSRAVQLGLSCPSWREDPTCLPKQCGGAPSYEDPVSEQTYLPAALRETNKQLPRPLPNSQVHLANSPRSWKALPSWRGDGRTH